MRLRRSEASLAFWVDPAEAFAALFGDESQAVFLDCGIGAIQGTSVIAAGTRLVTARVADGTICVDGVDRPGEIFDFVHAEIGLGVDGAEKPDTVDEGFRLGWVGWLGYELGSQTLGRTPMWQAKHPDAALIYVDRAISFDHASHTVRLMALGESGDWSGELLLWRTRITARLAALMTAAASGEAVVAQADLVEADRVEADLVESGAVQELEVREKPAAPETPAATWAHSDEHYLQLIEQCLRHIEAGDAYQLCLTTEVRVDVHPEPFLAYRALRVSSPSHHGAFFRIDGVSLLSASPERFLAVSPAGVIESKPIKGTSRRGLTASDDAALAAALRGSEKERAENLMIVDLMRNDIARVSEIGTVTVPLLAAVETYAHVHQLVSTVRGQLRTDLGVSAALRACFPAGSMTGAPKHSAVSILERLEKRPRGIYSGAFGYVGLDGRSDFSVVIRSIVVDSDGAHIGTGGGITAGSIAELELAEVKLKAAALLAVLGVLSPTD